MRPSYQLFLPLLLCCLIFQAFIPQPHATEVPESLKEWVPWVLDKEEDYRCTRLLGTTDKVCGWQKPLSLTLDDKGGSFSQQWQLEQGGWILLPGDHNHWPQDVTLNDDRISLLSKDGVPALFMEKGGRYEIKGHFIWPEIPESLAIAPGTPLISPLVINGVTQIPPEHNGNTLWLAGKKQGQQAEQDSIRLQVYRLIHDKVPLQMESRLELQVGGNPREIVLDWVPPADQIPLSLASDLPVKLDPDGQIRVQARAGRHYVRYISRSSGPVHELQIEDDARGPEIEYWSFAAYHQLRVVEVSGVTAVDPGQTSIPSAWRQWPAYRVAKGDTFTITTVKRGDPDPPPNRISLHRNIWLDGDGQGLTIQDQLSGTVSAVTRLTMQEPGKLGRMVVNGKDQLITRLEDSGPPGVEFRLGQLQAEAVSRVEQTLSFPAGGWSTPINKLQAVLHLPPGWKVLHIQGSDSAATWVSQWTLMDCFVVLVIVFATFQLLGVLRALVALVVLVIIYHDHNAPIYIWLALLACIAVLRAVPSSHFRGVVKMVRLLLLAVLVLQVLPFCVEQLRVGIFPQLEKVYPTYRPVASEQVQMAPGSVRESARNRTYVDSMQAMAGKGKEKAQSLSAMAQKQEYGYDTKAKIQAGPGVPAWQWHQVRLNWSGPVAPDLQLNLVLLSPLVNLILAFVKVALLLLLCFFMLERRGMKLQLEELRRGSAAVFLVALSTLMVHSQPARAQAFPDQELLNALHERLLEPPECYPYCADFPEMNISMEERTVTIRIQASCAARTAVPLPRGDRFYWNGIRVDRKSVAVYEKNNTLWIPLAKGHHTITLEGMLAGGDVQLAFPLVPHKVAFTSSSGWTVQGISAAGAPEKQLQFIRKVQKEEGQEEFNTTVLPPFLRVERILHLGLQWQVETIVTRMSPAAQAVYLAVPLVAGEAVTDPDLKIKDGAVQVQLEARQKTRRWTSVLTKQQEIALRAPETDQWFEVWRLDASPVWHVELDGLIPIHHQSSAGVWQPEWRPWPGEDIRIKVSRPEGVEGPTKTIDSSMLKVSPGRRSTDMVLNFVLRSTRGDRQHVTLPRDAELQSVKINGREQPISSKDGQLILPISPGKQNIEVSWRTPSGIGTLFRVPKIDLGSSGVNSRVEVQVGKRWVWFVQGPRMGPAILFYSEVLIILFVAIVLGRSSFTPMGPFMWAVLGLGLSQSGLAAGLIIVAWFGAFELRRRKGARLDGLSFNGLQVALIVLTMAAFGAFLFAVQAGLLGHPDMLVAGNSSNSYLLKWYQDRIDGILPQPLVVSVPIMAYRAVMLIWALWLAFSCIRWVKWGWSCFCETKLWAKVELKPLRSRKKEQQQNVLDKQKVAEPGQENPEKQE